MGLWADTHDLNKPLDKMKNHNDSLDEYKWMDTNYVNDPLDRNEQIPNNFPRALDIC